MIYDEKSEFSLLFFLPDLDVDEFLNSSSLNPGIVSNLPNNLSST